VRRRDDQWRRPACSVRSPGRTDGRTDGRRLIPHLYSLLVFSACVRVSCRARERDEPAKRNGRVRDETVDTECICPPYAFNRDRIRLTGSWMLAAGWGRKERRKEATLRKRLLSYLSRDHLARAARALSARFGFQDLAPSGKLGRCCSYNRLENLTASSLSPSSFSFFLSCTYAPTHVRPCSDLMRADTTQF
jgi:hypothetical protein